MGGGLVASPSARLERGACNTRAACSMYSSMSACRSGLPRCTCGWRPIAAPRPAGGGAEEGHVEEGHVEDEELSSADEMLPPVEQSLAPGDLRPPAPLSPPASISAGRPALSSGMVAPDAAAGSRRAIPWPP
eukprot:5977078-Prymnesium_polylepis.2